MRGSARVCPSPCPSNGGARVGCDGRRGRAGRRDLACRHRVGTVDGCRPTHNPSVEGSIPSRPTLSTCGNRRKTGVGGLRDARLVTVWSQPLACASNEAPAPFGLAARHTSLRRGRSSRRSSSEAFQRSLTHRASSRVLSLITSRQRCILSRTSTARSRYPSPGSLTHVATRCTTPARSPSRTVY